MNETPDPLEAELTALRPREVSPGLRQRVAERLAEFPTVKSIRPWRLALASGLAAACLAVVLLWREGGGGGISDLDPVLPPQPPPSVVEQRPTLLAYERALGRSPEALDALLSKHAVTSPESNADVVHVGASFMGSDAALHALLGED
jgi:hypothetical protein